MKLRTLIFWPHLIAGVVAGTVILIMSVTGVLLTYERQMVEWSNSDLRSVPPAADAPRMPVEEVLAGFARWRPDLTPASVAIGAEADDPVIVSAGPQASFYLDAYTGRVLGEGRQGMRQFLSDVRSWHRWLAYEGESRVTAKLVTGWSNVVFLFIVLSGLYLWIPRRWTWRHLRPVVLFTSASGKARDFNWHNVIGLWSVVPLAIVVASAVPISFQWGNDLVYRAVGEEPPARRGGGPGPARGGGEGRRRGGPGEGRASGAASESDAPGPSFAGVDTLLARATAQEPEWETITARLPESPRAPLAFAIDRGDGGQPQLRSTLTLDRSGRAVSYETFGDQSLGRRIRSIMRFAHTGEVLGIPGQTIAGLATAGSVVLVWTGIALALRRLRAWLTRRRTRQVVDSMPKSSAA
jgi:uncharacterized iron-regulated membrane protein